MGLKTYSEKNVPCKIERSVFLPSSYSLRRRRLYDVRGRTETWKANDSVFGGVAESHKKKQRRIQFVAFPTDGSKRRKCAVENRGEGEKENRIKRDFSAVSFPDSSFAPSSSLQSHILVFPFESRNRFARRRRTKGTGVGASLEK